MIKPPKEVGNILNNLTPILEICFDNEFCVIFLRKKPNPHNKSCYVFLILFFPPPILISHLVTYTKNRALPTPQKQQ